MELRAGYKQSEYGPIPSDWTVKQIEADIDLLTGFPFPSNKYSLSGVKLLRGSNIKRGVTDWAEDITQYWEKLTPELKVYSLMVGDIVIAMDGSLVGRSFARLSENDLPALLLQRVARVRSSKIEMGFLKEFICSDYFTKYCDSVKTSSAIPHISPKDIRSFFIPIPPAKSEQSAIATALSDADALISSLEKLVAKKRNIKQGAMQKLLQPKEGWVHKILGEIGEITGAGVDKLVNEDEVPVRLVNYMDVFRKDFIYSNELSHWVTAPQSKIQKCAVKQGDIFFTPSSEMRFDIAISAIAMEDIPDAAYSYHLVRLRLFEDWDLNFRTYIFKTNYFLGQAEQVCEGSGKRYVITLPKFRSLKIYFPPAKKEQNRIATILSDMDAEISALETKLEKYRNVKLGMMQNLLTGKIRLV